MIGSVLKYTSAILLCSLLTACASLPEAGPSATDVATQSKSNEAGDGADRYGIVDIDAIASRILQRRGPESMFGSFPEHGGAADPRIGVGDFLSVTIWEAASGGLFSAPVVAGQFSTGSKSVSLPDQAIGRDGRISVPYVTAPISVVGKTPLQVKAAIEKALDGKAIQPQVQVSITRQVSSTVTVTGEVTNGAVIPLTAKGMRILDVIAAAGGVHSAVHETSIRLSRGNRTVAVSMSKIVSDPRENINVRAGDVITAVRSPQFFIASGATGVNAMVPFDSERMTLSQALGRVGGLQDNRSDPTGVFVFRYEPYSVAHALLPNNPLVEQGRLTPIVYRLNMRDTNSLFVAQTFPIFNKDVIYVSNAPIVEVQKAMQIFTMISQPVTTGVSVSTSLKASGL